MYFIVPIDCTLDLTSGVRATGEKTAREPVFSLTMVPRPPILIKPKRRKGTLRVVIVGVISRITMTFAGSAGTSFAADLDVAMIAMNTATMRAVNKRLGDLTAANFVLVLYCNR